MDFSLEVGSEAYKCPSQAPLSRLYQREQTFIHENDPMSDIIDGDSNLQIPSYGEPMTPLQEHC